MVEQKNILKNLLIPSDKEFLDNLIKNKDAIYYIELEIDFYLKIPKGDNYKNKVLIELKIKLPDVTPDIDNLTKFLLDTMHDVLYDDDKRIVGLKTNKYYSVHERTEINAKIIKYKG